MTVASYEFGKELTVFSLVAGRLILFVMIDYVSKKCYYESCEQEQQFPCNEHRHHLPSREGKKNLRSRKGSNRHRIWCSTGTKSTEYILSQTTIKVNTEQVFS